MLFNVAWMKKDVRTLSMVKIIMRVERQAHKTTFNLLFASIYIFSCFSCCCCCCLFYFLFLYKYYLLLIPHSYVRFDSPSPTSICFYSIGRLFMLELNLYYVFLFCVMRNIRRTTISSKWNHRVEWNISVLFFFLLLHQMIYSHRTSLKFSIVHILKWNFHL